MTAKNGFRVVVATDGSRHARAAVATAIAFPWPADTRVLGVVARRTPATAGRPGYVLAAYDRAFARIAAATRHALAHRWPDAEVTIADRRPVDAILAEAQRSRAGAIVMGSRGHGAFRRLLLGSVSRGVARAARCPVLVAPRRPAEIRRFVVGLDGSANARRAAGFLGGLRPPRGARVTLVRVVERVSSPSMSLLPASVRATLRAEAAELEAARVAEARRDLEAVAGVLKQNGWTVETSVRSGAPLAELLAAADAARADVLVVGARGAGAIARLLVGSVAEGALNHARIPVLVAR